MLNFRGNQFTAEEVDWIVSLAGVYDACKQNKSTHFPANAFRGNLGDAFFNKLRLTAAIWETNRDCYRVNESSQDIFGQLLAEAKQAKADTIAAQQAANECAQDKKLSQIEKKTTIGRNIVYIIVTLLALLFGVTTIWSCVNTNRDHRPSTNSSHEAR